jgi:hypothetical protein
MGRERNEGGWYLRFKLRRIEIRSQRCPFPIRLAESRRGSIMELYVFRGTAGKAEMITDDKKRQEIPPHSFGGWVFSTNIVVAPETCLVGGVDCARFSQMLRRMAITIGPNCGFI